MITLFQNILLCAFSAIQLEQFNAPGFSQPVCGTWFTQESPATSAMPLGGLGTGYIDLKSDGTFGDAVMENNWLKPQPTNENCGFTIKAGAQVVDLTAHKNGAEKLRFWGHYPMADLDFADTLPVTVYARAFAPVIPHDYVRSGLPVALFRYYFENKNLQPVPVEIQLQWRQPTLGTNAEGNVEGALGWHLDSLAAGKTWTVTPTLVYVSGREQLETSVAAARVPMMILEPQKNGNENIYISGGISDFCLNGAGGFNWEEQGRHSGVFEGKPSIGHILWDLKCGKIEAGRGIKGSYGLRGEALPTKTAGGELEISLKVYKAGDNAIALAYTFTNVSGKPLEHLRFGFSVNADLGGADNAKEQRAEADKRLHAIVFDASNINWLLALTGDASDYAVGVWPAVHEQVRQNQWTSFSAPRPESKVRSFPDGIQISNGHGSYAIGSEGDGWAIESISASEGLIRTRASRTLGPGEKVSVSFGLAWHFPLWVSSDGEGLRHRYDVDYKDAGEVLRSVLLKSAELGKSVISWQEKIYQSPAPNLLKDAVINGLYIWPRNSWWLADGRFFQSESFSGCPITETFVCRFNGSFPLAAIFPQCEKATMESVAKAQAETGEIPFGFGSPAGSRSPYFHVQHPIVSPEFVLVTWRNYELWHQYDSTGADEYLRSMYPHIQGAMRFAMKMDKDKDGLVNEDPGSEKGFPANQYYDIWPWWGTSAYTGSIWLAALKAAAKCANLQQDAAFEQEMTDWYGRGATAFGNLLWTGSYYRLYNSPAKKKTSETSLTNALCGQWFAYASGLGDIVPKEHVAGVIDTVLKLNVAATPYGAVNGVKPDGKVDESFPDHSAVNTIGELWNFCAMAAFAGRTDDAVKLFNTSYENILIKQRTPWNIPWSLDRKTGAIKWGINYYSNPCVWTLFGALAGDVYGELAKE